MADDIKCDRQQSSDVAGMPEGLKPFKGLLRFHRKTQSSLCHSSPSQSDGSRRGDQTTPLRGVNFRQSSTQFVPSKF